MSSSQISADKSQAAVLLPHYTAYLQDSKMSDTSAISPPSVTKPTSPTNAEPRRASDNRRVLACGTCRKRKLKCDSKRPKCSTCARLGHPCEYDEVRKKSGPKRGYVKELEARLKQVETLLTSNHSHDTSPPQPRPLEEQQPFAASGGGMNMFTTSAMNRNGNGMGGMEDPSNMIDPNIDLVNAYGLGGIDDFNWDMISLGLEEPLPAPEVMDELYQIYFEKIHPSLPMIHKPRFLASLNMPVSQRPPVALRYIMWAHACAMSNKYGPSADQFYQKARKYIEQDEMKGHGEAFISVHHCQTWILIATHEFKTMCFPRAWMSCGKATRLSQLMGLHRQDRVGLDVKQTLAPPKDWIEREERRRTFWMAYCNDRYASIGTGWPMMVDERDILTNLPASDEAFLTGKAEPTPQLADVLAGDGTSGLSAFAAVVLLATLFGRNLTHLHRPGENDNDHDLNGEFWKRHRGIDNALLNISLSLPAHLRLPYGLNDANIVFANMSIHTSTICLHQAAIFKADKHTLPPQISSESKRRCIVAADQITNIMKMCSHQDLTILNPFIAFCLYVAARVFVQYLKSKKHDMTVRASLTFILSAMVALRAKNPLTESFLVQLDVDLEGSGLNIPSPLGANRYVNRPAGECPANTDAVKCSPLIELRETQSLGHQGRGLNSTGSDQIDPTDIDFSNVGSSFMTHYKMQRMPAQRVQSVSSDSPHRWTDLHRNTTSHQSPSGDGQSNGSHSNQPTPTSSNQNSSNTSHSPPMDYSDNIPPFFSNENQAKWPLPGNTPNTQPGIFPSDQQATANSKLQQQSTSFQQSQQFVDIQDLPNEQTNLNGGNMNDQSGFGNLFGGTGFTPGPTGFTPGPTGTTPGPWGDLYMQNTSEWNEQ